MQPNCNFSNYLVVEEYQSQTKDRAGVCRAFNKITGKEVVLKHHTLNFVIDEYDIYDVIGSHPNILKVEDFNCDSKPRKFYFWMEVGMIDLYNFVQLYGVLGEGLLVKVKESMLKAIAHIHLNGYIHCDIKPGNIMLMKDGSIKLFDFSHALFDELLDEEIPLGTYLTSAPEVLTKSSKCDSGVDYWSLGASLLFLQNGRFPFEGETVIEILKSIVGQLGAPTQEECPSLFRHLGEISNLPSSTGKETQILPNPLIGNLLSYDPKNRIES